MARGLLIRPCVWRRAHVRMVGASPSGCRLEVYLRVSRLLVLGTLLYGCGTPGTPLADWRDQLTLKVDVADRASSVATNLHVSFRAPDTGRCPLFDATVHVNGVKLPEVSRAGESSPDWVQIQSDPPDPCNWPSFGLEFSALPTAWHVASTQVRISDESAAFVADVENLFVGPTLAFPLGDAPELHPGATVTLSISPPQSTLVDDYATLRFVSDDPEANAATFSVSNGDGGILSLDEQSVTFVVPSIEPASGTLVLSAQSLRPRVLNCRGLAGCDVPRDPYALYPSAPLLAVVVP